MEQIRSQNLRIKLLKILDGRPDLMHSVFHLNNLRYADQIVDWLLRHGFKGNVFKEWLNEKHQGSILNLCSFVAAEINRTTAKPLRFGRDYLGNPKESLKLIK